MEFEDFLLMRKGWMDKLIYEQKIYKQMTMIIASSMVGGKNINPQKLWPIKGDKAKVKMVTYGATQLPDRLAMKLKRAKERKNE